MARQILKRPGADKERSGVALELDHQLAAQREPGMIAVYGTADERLPERATAIIEPFTFLLLCNILENLTFMYNIVFYYWPDGSDLSILGFEVPKS